MFLLYNIKDAEKFKTLLFLDFLLSRLELLYIIAHVFKLFLNFVEMGSWLPLYFNSKIWNKMSLNLKITDRID